MDKLASLPIDVKHTLEAFLSNPQIKCVGLYGSFATGNTHPSSDIDIVLAKEVPLSIEERIELVTRAVDFTDRKIDLVDLHSIHPPLSQEIFKTVFWFKKEPHLIYKNLVRTLFETADFLPIRQRIEKQQVKRFIK